MEQKLHDQCVQVQRALECRSYRGIKLLEHAMKVFERVLESRLRQTLHIDDMQLKFTPGKGTTDAVFILRQLQERYLVKKEGSVDGLCGP